MSSSPNTGLLSARAPSQRRKLTSLPPRPSINSFFFPSILAGPSYTYSSYEAFTSHALFLKEAKATPSSGISRPLIPEGRRRKAAKRFITGIIYLGIYSVYGWQFGYARMLEDGFAKKSFWHR